MNKKRLVRKTAAIVAAATLLLSTGCGANDTASNNTEADTEGKLSSSSSVSSEEEVEKEEVKEEAQASSEEDTLTFSFSDEISNIDIIHAYAVENDIITTSIAEQLYYYGADSSIQKGLVESDEQPADNVYVYNIKENVNFSDGTPLTADDVVYSLER